VLIFHIFLVHLVLIWFDVEWFDGKHKLQNQRVQAESMHHNQK
jgi:hypothetical protein